MQDLTPTAETAAAGLERGRTLPFAWYTDPSLVALEQRRIFRRAWQYAGRADQVERPASYFTCRAGDVPIVVVRDRGGALRAFVNVCRHRGAVLVEGEGRRETLQCRYHAWTYGLEGSLRSAPRTEREAGFDASETSLLPASVDTWGPFVFVNPDPEAAPLADTLGDLPALVAAGGLRLESLRFHTRAHFRLGANWKVACENFLECYHCPTAHPSFSSVVDVDPDAYRLEARATFASQYGTVRESSRLRPYDPAGEVAAGQFHLLWPNTKLNVMPGRANLSIGPVLPAGPEATEGFLDYFFGEDVDDAWIADLLAFDDEVGREDAALVESVQRGLRSGAVADGTLLPASEGLIQAFGRYVVGALR